MNIQKFETRKLRINGTVHTVQVERGNVYVMGQDSEGRECRAACHKIPLTGAFRTGGNRYQWMG